jgi:hypothetical protein
VDLQLVFNRCYDAGPYRRRIHYLEESPVPPLSPEQEKWVKGLLDAGSKSAGQQVGL